MNDSLAVEVKGDNDDDDGGAGGSGSNGEEGEEDTDDPLSPLDRTIAVEATGMIVPTKLPLSLLSSFMPDIARPSSLSAKDWVGLLLKSKSTYLLLLGPAANKSFVTSTGSLMMSLLASPPSSRSSSCSICCSSSCLYSS